ncbi:MAG: 3-deoxy-manno-octulosonate cytidylyltransferase [Candidatus Obscuribacterales bacterium]|nr:3-deoxy-manno-octulosonate cytidylyltransferase [Candidatus Obscuribacterales bacterium]
MVSSSSKKAAVIIPARYQSTRFPGKPLVDICGMTMIERVYTQAKKAKLVDQVIVATDDQRIFDVVRSFGGDVLMTRADHANGSERLAEVAANMAELEIIVNVQGDEPLIDPLTIDAAIRPLLENEQLEMSTLASEIKDQSEIESATVVKVVTDKAGCALYFSRSPIPFYRDLSEGGKYFGHIGLYVYRRQTLLALSALKPTPLELAENLEQLRALEHGIKIRVVQVAGRSPAVDKPEDLAAVEKALSAF